VRQAQQTLLIPLTILLILPSLAVLAVPAELQARLLAWLVEANLTGIALGAIAGLLLVDVALVAAALKRFQRARLILD